MRERLSKRIVDLFVRRITSKCSRSIPWIQVYSTATHHASLYNTNVSASYKQHKRNVRQEVMNIKSTAKAIKKLPCENNQGHINSVEKKQFI